MNDAFLPEGYEVPVSSNYMKLQQGENRFRVLDSAIIGQEFWIETKDGRKPVRKHKDEAISPNELGADATIKHFWAFPVYNVNAKKVQILELTQKSIMNAVNNLVKSEDWGNPKEYDIIVTKEGEGMQTEYHVVPTPKKKLDAGIVQLYKDMNIDINQLFDGDDPFKTGIKTIDDQIAQDAEAALGV
jgi:hypothetical protein